MLAIGVFENISLQLLPKQKKHIGKVTGMPLGGVCNVLLMSGEFLRRRLKHILDSPRGRSRDVHGWQNQNRDDQLLMAGLMSFGRSVFSIATPVMNVVEKLNMERSYTVQNIYLQLTVTRSGTMDVGMLPGIASAV
jgi:hypothetical protein